MRSTSLWKTKLIKDLGENMTSASRLSIVRVLSNHPTIVSVLKAENGRFLQGAGGFC